MSMLFVELLERLKQVDEITLLEILDISSEEIVDRFQDIIETRFDILSSEYNEEESDQN